MKKIAVLIALILALTLSLASLTGFGETLGTAETAAVTLDLSEYFSDRDLAGTWDADEAVTVALTGSGADCDSAAVTVADGTITIAAAGTYVLSGSYDGAIIVNAADDEKVQLVLNGVSLAPASGAAIVVESADKVFITLAEDTENTITCTGFDETSDIDAAIFARDDIAFNGGGALTITSAGHGIVGKDDVKFASGTYTITAENRGIDANDSVRVAGGSFTIVSGKDGIRAKNDEDDTKGYIVIFDGTFAITAGGGAQNGAAHSDGTMGFGRQAASASEGSSTSTKGIKASGDLTIVGGSFTVDAADDAFHSDANLTVTGGAISAASGDDGMHANATLSLSGGTIAITRSYEGLEGQTILISGGDISVTASDDGLNAAGGSDGSGYGFYDRFSGGDALLSISGGTLYVNASGDGLDSNGDMNVSGGTIVVSGPTNSGNGALDFGEQGAASITGGTLIAAGASGMGENFGSGSTQVSMLVNLSGQGGAITVTDASGNVVLSGEVEKSFGCVVISSPDLKVGETYTVSCGGSSTSVEVTGTIVGGMGMGGMMGGMNGQGFSGRGGQTGQGKALPGGDFQPGELPEGSGNGQFPGPQGGGRGHGGNGN